MFSRPFAILGYLKPFVLSYRTYMLRRKGQNLQLVFQVQKNHRFMAEFFVGRLPIIMYDIRFESVPLIIIT